MPQADEPRRGSNRDAVVFSIAWLGARGGFEGTRNDCWPLPRAGGKLSGIAARADVFYPARHPGLVLTLKRSSAQALRKGSNRRTAHEETRVRGCYWR